VDLTSLNDAENKAASLGLPQSKQHVIPLSAKTGYKIDRLKDAMTLLAVGDPMPLISEVNSN